MKVLVTKDSFGVQVWYSNTKLERRCMADDLKTWVAPFRLRRQRLFSSKDVRRHLPGLGSDMKDGDIALMELHLERK